MAMARNSVDPEMEGIVGGTTLGALDPECWYCMTVSTPSEACEA